MAKKKRRGRPPGSKNKTTLAKQGGSVGKMDIAQLRAFISRLQDTLAARVQQQRKHLEGQLAALQGYRSTRTGGSTRAALPATRKVTRAKPKPKYQSKKNKTLKWTGRGVTPTWMREEMKGTKLKKDDFLIK